MKPLDPELLSALTELPASFGSVWSDPAKDLAAAAANLDDEDRRQESFRHALAAGYFTQFSAYSDRDLIERVVDWQLRDLEVNGFTVAKLPPLLAESPLVRPETLVKRGNRLLSPDFLRYLAYARLLQQHALLTKPQPRILEIGSGYGGMARVLKRLVPGAQLILADLPASLVHAYLFLGTEFPEANLVVAREGDDPEAFASADFVFVPVHRAGCLKGMNVDLAMNVFSFGEIPNEWNRQWFELLQSGMNVERLFLLNSFLKRLDPRSSNELSFGKWLPNLDERWRINHFEIDPRFHRCPFVTSFPNSVAILAQRIGVGELNRERVRVREEFEAMLPCDWIAALDLLDPAEAAAKQFIETSHHVGCWNVDPGTSGPVFRLWQQFRLNRDERALRLLLAYLRIVRGHGCDNFRFKDEFFLRELLSREELARECDVFFRNEMSIALHFDVQKAADLAVVLRKGGGPDEAANLYRKILEVVPGHGESLFQLGALAEGRGDLLLARDYLLKALALLPDNPAWREQALNVCTELGWRQVFTELQATAAPLKLSQRERCHELVRLDYAGHGLCLDGIGSAALPDPSKSLVREMAALAHKLNSEGQLDLAERLWAALAEAVPESAEEWVQPSGSVETSGDAAITTECYLRNSRLFSYQIPAAIAT